MIETEFYLSDEKNIPKAMDITGLSFDEIESIVGGYFRSNSQWAGKLRGKIVKHFDNKIEIRTSFGNKLLWSSKDEI